MFSYRAYGLGIHSEIPLPACPDAERSPDITIRLGKFGACPAVGQARGSYFFVDSSDRSTFVYEGVGIFVVCDGSLVTIYPEPGMDPTILGGFLSGNVLAALLHQRGSLSLHASSVGIGRDAVAFLGASGDGKSSIAAAMHSFGHPMLADDATAVQWLSDRPFVFPAMPILKLLPGIALALGYPEDSTREVHPLEEKRVHTVARPSPDHRFALQCLFVLDRQAAAEIEPLTPRQAVVELIRHSYPTRFLQPAGEAHLRRCAALAAQVPTFRLRSFHTTATLSRIVDVVASQAWAHLPGRA